MLANANCISHCLVDKMSHSILCAVVGGERPQVCWEWQDRPGGFKRLHETLFAGRGFLKANALVVSDQRGLFFVFFEPLLDLFYTMNICTTYIYSPVQKGCPRSHYVSEAGDASDRRGITIPVLRSV